MTKQPSTTEPKQLQLSTFECRIKSECSYSIKEENKFDLDDYKTSTGTDEIKRETDFKDIYTISEENYRIKQEIEYIGNEVKYNLKVEEIKLFCKDCHLLVRANSFYARTEIVIFCSII